MGFRRVVLEVSLKPFFRLNDTSPDDISREIFNAWSALTAQADEIAILLWTGDGSEILEYKGSFNHEITWACYIGGANPKHAVPSDPHRQSLHSTRYPYRENPPALMYQNLADIVASLRKVGIQITGKPLRIGATFDPGPELAPSVFKYHRHPEICLAGTMGDGQHRFVTCYASLHADPTPYAGFPAGIPEGTTLGHYLGKQAHHFLTDLGFDYLWFSNGFGFGTETWSCTGVLFDGKAFHDAHRMQYRNRVLSFWRDFRANCSHPIEVRGTNLSIGTDMASDACPARQLYDDASLNFSCPPNSPWAAIDGDFGLEIMGYLSRIARIPQSQSAFPFRFYAHDPWWLNSPWLDRYGRQPHDIYLPMAVARITETGHIQTASDCEILTIDDSLGQMPPQVPNEVIPHLLAGHHDRPDAPGLIVWLYPFNTLDNMTFGDPARLSEVFFHDQLLRGGINQGLPVNTVMDDQDAIRHLSNADSGPLTGRILLSRVPDADDPLSNALLNWVKSGGSALLYGPLRNASKVLLDVLNLSLAAPLEGEMSIELPRAFDAFANDTPQPGLMIHRATICAGGCEEIPTTNTPGGSILATATQGSNQRILGVTTPFGSGLLAWVRGSISYDFTLGSIGIPDADPEHFHSESLMRHALDTLGYSIRTKRFTHQSPPPVSSVSRHDNAWYFNGYCRDTTVETHLRFPQGAPLLVGHEARYTEGFTHYHLPRAWHMECRVFVDQKQDSVLSCVEQHSGDMQVHRRLALAGLIDATIRFYPPTGQANGVSMLINGLYPYYMGDFASCVIKNDGQGDYLEGHHITGRLLISW